MRNAVMKKRKIVKKKYDPSFIAVLACALLSIIPHGGGTCENFDRDARVIFLGLKFMKMSFFWVWLTWRHFFGVVKLAVFFWAH